MKQLARLIRRICPNKMYIDWENYNKIGFPVDYYGVTLKNGTILKNRIYYLIEGSAITSISPVFDLLVKKHILRCFSVGIENGKDYYKFDYRVKIPALHDLIVLLRSELPYIDERSICELCSYFTKSNKQFYLRVLGITANLRQKQVDDICLYFYTHEKICYDRDQKFFNEIGMRAFNKSLPDNIVWPVCNEYGYLCFAALDFNRNGSKKIKFYFEFLCGYEQDLFMPLFENTNMYDHVCEIVKSNARIDMYQVAIDERGEVSYNFYLKEKKYG